MVRLDGRDSGREVGHDGEAAVLNSRFLHCDGFTRRRHANKVSSELSVKDDFFRRFVPGSVSGEVDGFGMDINSEGQPLVHELVADFG